ncbi:MAG TPA: 2'-5' RNA ligase family protein [Actinomycetota bacterium]|nr:2'-5' RNA ligase family protein [Actinomycetota bacterium]
MARARLGVIARLPEPLAIHVQAWRRALGDPQAGRIGPHLTLAPPQTVAERDLGRAVALVERVAAEAVPFLVELDGAATFLPESPVAYLVVREGGPALQAIEAALREPPLERRTHPFHPHVTVVQDLPADRIDAAARELDGFRAAFPVRELALLREDRDKVWRPLATATVGASTAVREVPFGEAASAALLLLDPDPPRVLLGLRTRDLGRRYPGAWDAIGGKPEGGESLLEALAREAREEAGIEPLDLTALGCFHDGDRADAYYLATAWKGRPSNREPSEHSELDWVALHEAAGRPLTPTTRAAVARLAAVLATGHRLHPAR